MMRFIGVSCFLLSMSIAASSVLSFGLVPPPPQLNAGDHILSLPPEDILAGRTRVQLNQLFSERLQFNHTLAADLLRVMDAHNVTGTDTVNTV
jgi:hypothetical protein